jgi:thiol-disulfide isomerase/thioredoxin
MRGSARLWLLSAGILAAIAGGLTLPLRAIPMAGTVTDIDGRSFTLTPPDTKATVLFFVTEDCPITNSYMPEMNRIVASYTPKRVRFFAVYSDSSLSVASIRKHAAEFGLQVPVIDDTAHVLVRRARATVNPEAAVLAPDGRLVYRGRIDDWYVDLGQRRFAAREHYLREALDAVLAGHPVATAEVAPVGCSIAP